MLSVTPQEVFDTRHRNRDQKRTAVLNAAAELFLKNGYHRTRLDDVAESLGITKPALYNYFKSKHDILLGCHMHGHDLIDASLGEIEEEGGDGLDRLRNLIRAYAGIMTMPFGMCLVRLDEHELSDKALKLVTTRRRMVDQRFKHYIETGIADGSIEPCDVRITAFWIAGALNWVSHWFKPGKGLSSGQLQEQLAEDLTRGVARGSRR